MAIPIQPKDQLGRFMLPQAPEQAGYYVYGNVKGVPGTGHLAQYAHPDMLSVIFWVEREWQAIDDRKFGIGNISVAGGLKYDHATHMKGIEMDIRPVRKDKMTGQAARCSYRDKSVYDQAATIKLVSLFLQHPLVRLIYFNDDKVREVCGPQVKSWPHHDDHLHVELWERP
jgi:penicillin-insensitive murein DD-endopeptidase